MTITYSLHSGKHEKKGKISDEERLFQDMQDCISKGYIQDGVSLLFALILKTAEREELKIEIEEELSDFHYYVNEASSQAKKLLNYLLGQGRNARLGLEKSANLTEMINISEKFEENEDHLPDPFYFSNLREFRSCLYKAELDTGIFDDYMSKIMKKLEEIRAIYLDGADMLTNRIEDMNTLFQMLSFSKSVDIVWNGFDCIRNQRDLGYELSWMTEENNHFLLSLDYQDLEIYGVAEMVTQLFRETYLGEDDCPF